MAPKLGLPTPKIGIPGSKTTFFGRASAILVVRRHLLVGFTLLNREIGRNVTATCPGHLLNDVGDKLQRRRDFLRRWWRLLIVGDR